MTSKTDDGMGAVPAVSQPMTAPAAADTRRFLGFRPRRCGEHRTCGRRAWCFDCQEWCYPYDPCTRCGVLGVGVKPEWEEGAR